MHRSSELALDIAVQGGSGALISFDQQLHLGALDRVLDSPRSRGHARARREPRRSAVGLAHRLAATPAETVYAILRNSADGERVAVNVYNLSDAASQITVDVSAVLKDGSSLIDLRGGDEVVVEGGVLTMDMDAWGWSFLEAGAESLVK